MIDFYVHSFHIFCGLPVGYRMFALVCPRKLGRTLASEQEFSSSGPHGSPGCPVLQAVANLTWLSKETTFR